MSRLRALMAIMILAVASQAAASSYTLRKGDTLSKVAKKHSTTVKVLADANNITDVNKVKTGQKIIIPDKAAKSTTSTTAAKKKKDPAAAERGGTTTGPLSSEVFVAGAQYHVVQPGETLSMIADKYNVSIEQLSKQNNITDPDKVKVGTRLRIPGDKWLCPVKGHNSPVDNYGAARPGGRRHQGVDIFAARGLPVVANVPGTIKKVSGSLTGIGYYLTGDDGVTYFGAHLDTIAVTSGRVDAGDVIGRVGNTGNASTTPTHLHFEIKPGGRTPVNPFPTLKKYCGQSA